MKRLSTLLIALAVTVGCSQPQFDPTPTAASEPVATPAVVAEPVAQEPPFSPTDNSDLYVFANCDQLRVVYPGGAAVGHCAYDSAKDRDKDGVACEVVGLEPARPYRNCTELRVDHPDGVPESHCAYAARMDRDKDGIACEA